jgi:serine/threonine-protein kinase/endoribonuclease IRE1
VCVCVCVCVCVYYRYPGGQTGQATDSFVDVSTTSEKRRQGGMRGGKQLRRRKEAISRQGLQASEGDGGESAEGAAPHSREAGERESVGEAGVLAGGGVQEGVGGAVGGVQRVGRLTVLTDKVLGHGSQGTIVYQGLLDDGRQVPILR